LAIELQKLSVVRQEKEKITEEIARLQIEVADEKKAGMIEINNLELKKIQAVQKLSEEMDYKVKETQANLMALNDEQLNTTTRLTILQNHQLTTELDYQSKQTEQLLAKNDKMQEQIDTLKRNISLHKQIEKQLAKRAHVSQGMINNLKKQAEGLESELSEHMKRISATRPKTGGDPNTQGGEALIDFLESKLEQIEMNF